MSLFFSIILFKSYVIFFDTSMSLTKSKVFSGVKNISTTIEAVVHVAT